VYNAAANAEEGGQFAYLRATPQLWLYGPDLEKVSGDLAIAESAVWASKGWEMQREDQVLLPLFLSALPFGYLPEHGNLNKTDRHWNGSDAIPRLLPLQFDCSGGHDALEMYVGRNGQVVTLDQWNPNANNHNSFTVAEPGAGKSVSENCKAIRYHAAGFQQIVVEAGRSFEPLVKLLKGTHVVVGSGRPFCVNPFSRFKIEEGDDAIDDAEALAGIMINMAYASVKDTPEWQTEITILKKAIRWAWREASAEADMGMVRTYLKEYPGRYLEREEWSRETIERWTHYAHDLALNISDFCPGGTYGRYFNGKTTLDVESSMFTVVELDGLLNQKALFKVLMLVIMDNISKVVYQGDRGQKKKIKVDEFHVLLKCAVHNLDVFFEQLYRRFRKHGGGIDIITQGILDFEKEKFGALGDIILNYSASKFYMQCGDYQTARERKVLYYNDLVMGLLKGVNSRKGFYSETMVDFGMDRFLIYRNVLPDYMKLLFTTDAREVTALKSIEQEITADPARFGVMPDDWLRMDGGDRDRLLADLRIKEHMRRFPRRA
jgi:conjugal transfer ATP-binding protein TraC